MKVNPAFHWPLKGWKLDRIVRGTVKTFNTIDPVTAKSDPSKAFGEVGPVLGSDPDFVAPKPEIREPLKPVEQCEYCETGIVWKYVIRFQGRLPGDKQPVVVVGNDRIQPAIIVGSECVKSFVDGGDPAAALAFLKGKWRQRRHYFCKRAHGFTFVIGQNATTGKWWKAVADNLRPDATSWRFSNTHHKTFDEAVEATALFVFLGRDTVARWVAKMDEVKRLKSKMPVAALSWDQ
jgi:hypothetical protein